MARGRKGVRLSVNWFAYFAATIPAKACCTNLKSSLASASPRREFLLREMGLHFKVIQPTRRRRGDRRFRARRARDAQRPKQSSRVAGRHRESLVIGADTEVVLDGRFRKTGGLGTRRDECWRNWPGAGMTFFTGRLPLFTGQLELELTFANGPESHAPVDVGANPRLFHQGHTLDKAGAYGAQEYGEMIIERVEGSFSNVMGLPVERLRATLREVRNTDARD